MSEVRSYCSLCHEDSVYEDGFCESCQMFEEERDKQEDIMIHETEIEESHNTISIRGC